ncbi:LOW QUALITY PROTEIN: hypothetical protein T265_14288, partial [Opisthorchis viverrini]
MVYNVHCLLHLPDDVSSHGPLDNFSAFPYGSYMFTLKRLVQSLTYPVRQIYKRLQESASYLTNTPDYHADCDAGLPLKQASLNKKRFFNLGKAYSLVKFHEQGLWQCAVLSSTWIEGNCATWPKIHSKDFYKAVRLHIQPPAGSLKLNCEVIRTYGRCHVDRINFSDDFKKAREHERKFQYTSDLETSDVTIEMGRNHPRRKNTRERSPSLSISPSPKKPKLMVPQSPPYSSFSQATPRALFHSTPEPIPQHPAPVPSTSNQPVYTMPQTVHHLPQYVLNTAPEIPMFPVLSPPSAPLFQTPGIAALLQQNEQLHRKMDAMAEDLRYPEIRIDNSLLQVHSSSGTTGFTFPLRSKRSWDQLESELAEGPRQIELMKYFRSFSAATMADLVRLCLRQALADEFAVSIAYAGSVDKLPFRHTRLCTLIEETVLGNPVSKDCCRQDLDKEIQKWFGNARHRLAQRTRMDQLAIPLLGLFSAMDTTICTRVVTSVVCTGGFLIKDHCLTITQTVCQSFPPHRSCVTNMLVFMDSLFQARDEGLISDAIFFEFSKAFDRVPHVPLLHKLESSGIQKNPSLDQSFPIRSSEKGSTYFSVAPVSIGVPQGSVLGPLLFLIYVNDLPDVLASSCLLFAGDLKSCSSNAGALQMDVDAAKQWSLDWHLPLNDE